MIIRKKKKPKHLSYVLKTSLIEKAFEEERISIHTELNYSVSQSMGHILSAFYWIPNENVDYPRLYAIAGVVPNNEHKHAYELLISDVIPSFIEWIREIVSLPLNSPFLDEKPYFNSLYQSGSITIERLPLNLFLQRPR